tara:strand:+ start:480 stop:2222 length:1743 start_codon:yes stop_codon:yes gene_type:complete
MNLIQQRQVQNLETDITTLKSDVLSVSNSNYDILNSNITFNGDKTFADDVRFDSTVRINTPSLAYDFAVGGDAFIEGGSYFYYGNSSKYIGANNNETLSIVANAAGPSGNLNLGANNSIQLNSSIIDLSNQASRIQLLQSSSALRILTTGFPSAIAIDTSSPSATKIGIAQNNPSVTLDVSGRAKIDNGGGNARVLNLGNTGSSECYVAYDGKTGQSLIGFYDDGLPGDALGLYMLAANPLDLSLGHTSRQFARIKYSTAGSNMVMGADASLTYPRLKTNSILEINSTGFSNTPILSLFNDATSAVGSQAYTRYIETGTSTPGAQSWAIGHYNAAGGSSSTFRIGYSGGYDARLGNNDYLVIDVNGDSTLGGNVNISGSIVTTGNVSPNASGLASLGEADKPWKDLYVDSGSIYIGNSKISESNGTITVSGEINSTAGTQGGGWENYQTKIKILPKDFVVDTNNGGANSRQLCYDYASTNKGLRVFDLDNDIYAFHSIPKGYRATGIMVYGDGTNGYSVQNSNLSGKWAASHVASGLSLNTALPFSPYVTGDETNFLVTKIDITATSDRVYGGYISIEKI